MLRLLEVDEFVLVSVLGSCLVFFWWIVGSVVYWLVFCSVRLDRSVFVGTSFEVGSFV